MTDRRRRRNTIPMALAGVPFKITGQSGSAFNAATGVELVPSMMNKQTFFSMMIIQVPARTLYLTEPTKDRDVNGQQMAR